jgi:GNAT superfamily N-acetyltransferase
VIVRETDEAFIRLVTEHSDVWRYVSGIEDYRPYGLPDGVYYTLVKDGQKAGFIVFTPYGDAFQAHIAVLPEHRGKWVESDLRDAIYDHGGKVVAKVRHQRVYALAYRVGFRKVGIDADGCTYMEFA